MNKWILCCLCWLCLPQSLLAADSDIGTSADAVRLKQQDQQWQQAIINFANADPKTVLTPYMQLLTRINHYSEYAWCEEEVVQLINQAIALNPSSLVAHSLLYTCAAKQHKNEQKQAYIETINGLIRNLKGSRAADSVDSVIEIREQMEAPLLLQAMGYTVLDVEMITHFGGVYYRYHVIDPIKSTVTSRYFSNLAFMKRLLFNDPTIADDTAAQLLIQYYEQQKLDFALTAKARRLIARKMYDLALTTLAEVDDSSMVKKVLLAHIYLVTEQLQPLQAIQSALTYDTKSGFIDAAISLATLKLRLASQSDEPTAKQQVEQLLAQVDEYTVSGEGAFRLALSLEATAPANTQTIRNQQAIDWLKLAVEQHHPQATLTLAKIYRASKLGNDDEKQAMALFQQAENYGIDEAAIEIAQYYHQGSESVAVDHEKELNILKRLANNQQPDALFRLAQHYENGIDVTADVEKAYDFYRKAYELGEQKAANQIGTLFERGALGNDKDQQLEQAFIWYEKASNQGDSNGFANIARFHQFGIGRERDLSKAAENYVHAAETGSHEAYCRLADILLQMEPRGGEHWQDTLARAVNLYKTGAANESKFCPRQLGRLFQLDLNDFSMASHWYEVAARNGDALAQQWLEQIYLADYVNLQIVNPSASEKNNAAKSTAFLLSNLNKTATMGLAKSNFLLGKIYLQGLNVPPDHNKAMGYLQRAAEKGHSKAQWLILKLLLQGQSSLSQQAQAMAKLDEIAAESAQRASLVAEKFFQGDVFKQDYKLALKYYRIAATQGSGNAMNHLGEMYRFGWGVSIDYDQAMQWYLKAVNMGYVLSAHNIAEMYYLAQGVSQNFALADDWFNKSAAIGISESQYYLGLMYQQGQGVTQNYATANHWFYQAMDQQHQGAKFELAKNMLQGHGIEKNPAQALLLITETAEADYAPAEAFLRQTDH